MKKLVVILILLISLASTQAVFAQGRSLIPTPRPKTPQDITNLCLRNQSQLKVGFIGFANLLEVFGNQLEVVHNRLIKLSNNNSSLVNQFALADNQKTSIKASISNLKTKVAEFSCSDSPGRRYQEIKTNLEQTINMSKTYKQTLESIAVELIKQKGGDPDLIETTSSAILNTPLPSLSASPSATLRP